MGKTPKKGDERNLYRRRGKPSSNTSETHLHNRQRESENPNRSKLSAQLRKVSPGQRKGFKNKVGTTAKFDSSRSTRQHKWKANSPKRKKKSTPETKSTESSLKMQPESETAEIKVDETSGNKTIAKPETSSKETRSSSMEKHVDQSEPVRAGSEAKDQQNGESSEKSETDTGNAEEEEEEEEEKANNSVETKPIDEPEEHEEADLKLSLDSDECSAIPPEQNVVEEPQSKENEEVRIEPESNAREQQDEVLRNDTESSTVEFAESVKSCSTEASGNSSQKEEREEKEKENENEKEETTTEKDESFVSYDPAIMLKDVQIKLNDCMKENAKTTEASSNADQQPPAEQPDQEQESEMLSRPFNDMSFGKTLRSMSGRRSLGRMRHVTIREQRYSPNNSMFVNTSGTSLMPDENEDSKIVRYNTAVSETVAASNGSSLEKKRKHEANEDRAGKKQKTETENSLLGTSISLLKGLRRPIQASTPVAELKFQTNQLDLLDDERDKSANDHQAPKKWCAFM